MEDWIYTNRFKLLFCGGAFLLIGIVVISLHLTKTKIASQNDLYFFTGRITDRQFYNSGRAAKSCWFTLKDNPNIFYIDDANLYGFDKYGFAALQIGDSARVGVSLLDSERLNLKQSSIFVFYFRSGSVELSYNTSIRNYNRNTLFYIGIGLIGIGILLFYNGFISKI